MKFLFAILAIIFFMDSTLAWGRRGYRCFPRPPCFGGYGFGFPNVNVTRNTNAIQGIIHGSQVNMANGGYRNIQSNRSFKHGW